ncbi:TetR/AcrR family transcriptional regulator [Kribbella sp. NPDC020789]
MRKDAELNRERLIAAAREVFAERGIDAALDAVAKRAGVSIGTLYNRFPTRNDLVRAAFADNVDTVARLGEHALGLEDPWDGFVYFVEQVSQLQAADRGYNELAARGTPSSEELARGYELMSRIVERAREGGVLRPDFTLEDMAFVTWSISRTIEATAGTGTAVWRRHLALILDGLRASAAHPLPVPPLSREELAEIYRSC